MLTLNMSFPPKKNKTQKVHQTESLMPLAGCKHYDDITSIFLLNEEKKQTKQGVGRGGD